jgi:hypothetical protein
MNTFFHLKVGLSLIESSFPIRIFLLIFNKFLVKRNSAIPVSTVNRISAIKAIILN